MTRLCRSALFLLLLLWPALARAEIYTDMLGRAVILSAPPQRIVSLVPSVTEVLYALGLEQKLVGVTSFCTYPEAARTKPQVGSYSDPSAEAIVAQRPDLLIASADAATPAQVALYERLGIPTYVIRVDSLPSTLVMLRQLGQVTGVPAAGERLARQLEEACARVRQAVADRPRPSVLTAVMVVPLTVAGPRTLIDDLLTVAGGRNVVPATPVRYPTWGAESVLAADPDVIIVSPHPGQPDPGSLFTRWTALTAVRQGRVVAVPADWLQRPGPRLALGLQALAKALHQVDVPLAVQP